MSTELQALGSKLFADFKGIVGKSWDSWTPEEQQICEECVRDYALLSARALAGMDVKIERGHDDAQLANIRVAGHQSALDILNTVLKTALDFARKSLLSSIIPT